MPPADELDFLGISVLLPLDFSAVVSPDISIEDATARLRTDGEFPSRIPFPYRQVALQGGGKIGNMLAFLGDERWHCAICGGTGNDDVGTRVLADLESYGVNTQHVAREDLPTRVRCILGRSGDHTEWPQFELTPSQLKFKPRWISELPVAANLLLGRGNKTINKLAERRQSDGTRIIAHVSDVPRRYPDEFTNLLAMLALADIVFAKAEAWRNLLGMRRDDPGDVLNTAERVAPRANLLVSFDRKTLRLVAKLRGDDELITAAPSAPTHPLDPTGSMDCAHAALLSFLAHSRFRMDRHALRGALGYAEDCAAFVSLGLGARFFPSTEYRNAARKRHKDSIPVKQRCFISHSKKEGAFVAWFKHELDRLPGTAVWFDDQDLSHGTEIEPAIRSAIDQSDIFFLICSPSIAGSDWVRLEAEHALASGKRIITIIRAGAKNPAENANLQRLGLAERCGKLLAADFTDDDAKEESMARLARSLA